MVTVCGTCKVISHVKRFDFYIIAFRIMCAVSIMAIFLSFLDIMFFFYVVQIYSELFWDFYSCLIIIIIIIILKHILRLLDVPYELQFKLFN